jgi:hypothetical protein
MARRNGVLGSVGRGLRALGALSALLTGLLACGGAHEEPERTATRSEATASIDVRRSLVVTEQVILERFSLKRVMDQLVAQSNVGGLTAKKLFRQWWDVQNPGPGLGAGPHCDDTVDATLGPVINGFPYSCRPAPSEGAQASCDPFAATDTPCTYIPIGLFNRFDIAPENGAFCGEYRIVYAKKTGVLVSDDRNLIIFEAAMPNPLPLLGLEGCRPLAEFWANLSNVDDAGDRADLLEAFYFQGLLSVPIFPPAVHIAHFGDNAAGRGQIRTNQFVFPDPRIWSLREFKLKRTCGLLSCSTMRVLPATVKGNPYGPLFSPALPHERAAAFQTHLRTQVAGLAASNIPDIDFAVPDTYNTAQSQANGLENNYLAQIGPDPSALRAALAAELMEQGSYLTPDQIVARAQAQSCAGCHRLSNNADLGGGIVWPPSQGFTHVTEREVEVVDGLARFTISSALTDAFLPHRKDVLERYLHGNLLLKLIPLRPIGGFLVH